LDFLSSSHSFIKSAGFSSLSRHRSKSSRFCKEKEEKKAQEKKSPKTHLKQRKSVPDGQIQSLHNTQAKLLGRRR
jgi:hypothetical protein